MKFSFRVYSHLAERGSGSRSEVSADELGKLGESILSFLTQAHLMHSHLNAEQVSGYRVYVVLKGRVAYY